MKGKISLHFTIMSSNFIILFHMHGKKHTWLNEIFVNSQRNWPVMFNLWNKWTALYFKRIKIEKYGIPKEGPNTAKMKMLQARFDWACWWTELESANYRPRPQYFIKHFPISTVGQTLLYQLIFLKYIVNSAQLDIENDHNVTFTFIDPIVKWIT
jgi:hypothetical protein